MFKTQRKRSSVAITSVFTSKILKALYRQFPSEVVLTATKSLLYVGGISSQDLLSTSLLFTSDVDGAGTGTSVTSLDTSWRAVYSFE